MPYEKSTFGGISIATSKMRALTKSFLPAEHGSWAFVLEPLLIGLVYLHDESSACLAVGGFFAFLAYRPASMGLTDVLRRKRYPRTVPGLAVGLSLGVTALGLILWVCAQNPNVVPLIGIAALLGAVFVAVDKTVKPRSLSRELLGSVLTIPLLLAALTVRFDVRIFGDPWYAFLVATLVLRAAIAVLAVRAVIDRFQDAVLCRWLSMAMSIPLILCAFLSVRHLANLPAYGLVAIRAIWFGLTPGVERVARKVGFQELAVSGLIVLSWSPLAAILDSFII